MILNCRRWLGLARLRLRYGLVVGCCGASNHAWIAALRLNLGLSGGRIGRRLVSSQSVDWIGHCAAASLHRACLALWLTLLASGYVSGGCWVGLIGGGSRGVRLLLNLRRSIESSRGVVRGSIYLGGVSTQSGDRLTCGGDDAWS